MEKKLKNPDLTRFGFYLYPKVYKGVMGFEKAHGLLFLDSRGQIEPEVAKDIGMTRLLNSSTSVLYSINPIGGRYPNASQLLKALSLGNIAKQRLITKTELRNEFLEQCAQCGISLDILDNSERIGVNRDGHTVFETKSGRYLTDERGQAHRDVSPERLLYGVDEDGDLVESQVEYCLESLFKFHLKVDENNLDFIAEPDFADFVETIIKHPPPVFEDVNDYTPIPFYDPPITNAATTKTSQIIDVLEKLEAKMMLELDFDDADAFEQFFHHVYYRALPSTNHGFRANLPAPLLVLLLKLMRFNDVKNPHITTPHVGNLALLAGMVRLKEEGFDVTISEDIADKQQYFNQFLEDTNVENLVVHSKLSAEDYHGTITYIPKGSNPTPILIPNSNKNTYEKNIVEILNLLDARLDEGRSIFITHVDEVGSLGKLSEDSSLLIKYLYEHYQNTLVFDCHEFLSAPSRHNCEYRIVIVGERINYSLLNVEELDRLAFDPKIETVGSPEDFYIVCSRYAEEIAAVEVSGIDLMDNLLEIIGESDDSDEDNNSYNISHEAKQNEGSIKNETPSVDLSKDSPALKDVDATKDEPTNSSDNSLNANEEDSAENDVELNSKKDSSDSESGSDDSSGGGMSNTNDDHTLEPTPESNEDALVDDEEQVDEYADSYGDEDYDDDIPDISPNIADEYDEPMSASDFDDADVLESKVEGGSISPRR